MAATPVSSQLSASALSSTLPPSEWLLANGAGAHAASTAGLEHTRGLHGLLAATVAERQYVVLARMDVRGTPIELDEDGTPRRRTLADLLSLNWSMGEHGVRPTAETFEREPLPRWSFSLPDVDGALSLELSLHPTSPAVLLRYGWEGDDGLRLHFRPLLAMRGVDERGKEHGAMSQGVEVRRGEARVQPRRDLPSVHFAHGGIFVGSPDWWLGEGTGHAFVEDLWTPGVLEAVLAPGESTQIVCSLGPLPPSWP